MRDLHSSGDLLADRRATYARQLAEDRDFTAAAEVMEQALELAPDWAAGWNLLADYRRDAGDIAGALVAWSEVERRDTAGIFGGALKRAAHGGGASVETTATGYVAALFDDYAEGFEAELLTWLHYAVPRQLDGMIGEVARDQRFGTAIDLGCGTGLMGERLRRRVTRLEGVDLSQNMLDEAARKGINDRLECAELTAHLLAHPGGVELITAADVLVYVGVLAPVLAAAWQALAPGGLLVFSVEAHTGLEPMILRDSYRFAHNRDGLELALAAAGYETLRLAPATLRHDRGAPIAGYLVVASKR